jgi:hypothetical protein
VYTITSYVSNAAAEDLRRASAVYPAWTDYYRRLPQDLPQPVRELARQLTEGMDNPYDRAVAIQEYLRRLEYTFEIEPVPANTDGVSFFLFQQRKGYCDYFASAMAVMLRSIGIPSRVVVGYVLTTPDTVNPNGFVVTGEDAHSWPEAYFPGYGWVEFEPTPARTLTPRPDETLGLPGGIGGGEGASEDSETGGIISEDTPLAFPVPETRDEWFISPQTLMTIVAAGVGLFFLFWLAWWRSLIGLSYPAQVYEQMVRLGGWLRVPALAHQTPSEYARRLKRVLPNGSDDVDHVTRTYNAMRFGRRRLDELAQADLIEAWRRLRRRLLLKFIRWKDS